MITKVVMAGEKKKQKPNTQWAVRSFLVKLAKNNSLCLYVCVGQNRKSKEHFFCQCQIGSSSKFGHLYPEMIFWLFLYGWHVFYINGLKLWINKHWTKIFPCSVCLLALCTDLRDRCRINKNHSLLHSRFRGHEWDVLSGSIDSWLTGNTDGRCHNKTAHLWV